MEQPEILIRAMSAEDCPAVLRLQETSPEAAQWRPHDYLIYESWVACKGNLPVGFIVLQPLPDETAEILNLVVHPASRRQGIARRLLQATRRGRAIFLEVRESNATAQSFYRTLGFVPIGARKQYYTDSPEGAIVMGLQKC